MIPTAREIAQAGGWPANNAAGRVVLAFDDRFRRRLRLTTEAGEDVLLDLAQTQVIHDGDALKLEDGRLIAVVAAAEPLMEARAASPALLMRLAWHIGNRHLPARLEAHRILLRRDHVIADMLRGLGAEVEDVSAPFQPEGGAYGEAGVHGGAGRGHGHSHGDRGHHPHHGPGAHSHD